MILAELVRRGRGDRMLVVTPQHILEQFQRELWTRFSIPLVRLDSVGLERIQREIPAGRNPFTYFKRIIISIDTLKRVAEYEHHLHSIWWDAVVIDVRDKTSIADYFVVCEGETDRQVRAIADGMVDAAKDKQLRPLAVDGYEDATWILLDFDSVLAHVFLPGERSYYDLESLWGRAAKGRKKAS